jgi:GGDEF domain-containing protein
MKLRALPASRTMIAGLVRAAIAEPIGLDALQFAITPSIGITLHPDHGSSAALLIAHAGVAMYRPKQLRSPCESSETPAAPDAAVRTLQA